jgi:F-type H+-transporting ATPase subunit b
VDINIGTLLGQSIAMIVFVWFCMKFIWPPLLAAIEERQQKIADGLAAADKGQQALEAAKAEADEIVSDARKQATGILDQAHARANEIVADGKNDGVKERDRQLTAAKADIEQESNKAREELRGQVSAIAIASAEKILRREIDDKQHEDILGKLAGEL